LRLTTIKVLLIAAVGVAQVGTDPLRGISIAFAVCTAVAAPSAIAVAPPHATSLEYRLLALEGQEVSWSAPREGLSARITYAFLDEPKSFPRARNCGAMVPIDRALAASHISQSSFRREVRAAFAMWSDVAAIEFHEVADAAEAGLLIGAQAEARGRAFTNVATNSPGSAGISQSLICLNPETPWKIGFDGNLDVYDLRYTLAHEIGHAIGLDHPGREGQLMSYRYNETSRKLQPGDIAGAVAIYGPHGIPRIARRLDIDTASISHSQKDEAGSFARGLSDPSSEPQTPSR